MLQTECINAVAEIALKNAISLSSRAVQGAVCRARASSRRILPPLERSISARAALARRICIRQFKFDRDQNQNTIVRNDRSRFPLTVRALLRWNAKNAAHAPPRTKGAIRVHDSAVLETVLESPVWVFLASLSGI